MTTREVLVAARALIDRPEKWTRGRFKGLTREGHCFCARGAVLHVTGASTGGNYASSAVDRAMQRALDESKSPLSMLGYVAFNDAPTTTHADVMALFDRAIAACGDA